MAGLSALQYEKEKKNDENSVCDGTLTNPKEEKN